MLWLIGLHRNGLAHGKVWTGLFERITINNQSLTGKNPIDLGFLAECLLFYRHVRVIADSGTFQYIVRCCGPDELMELGAMGVLEIEFFNNTTAVRTIETNIGPMHDLVVFEAHKTHYPYVARRLFDEMAGTSGKGASRMFNKFERLVERSVYTKEMLKESGNDLTDQSYVVPAIKSLVAFLAPEYAIPNPFRFQVQMVPNHGYHVSTDINFDELNSSYHKHVPKEQSSLGVAYLLGNIADTRRDLLIGARQQSEFALAPERGLVAACKFAEIISTANRGVTAGDTFREAVVDGVPSIREVINSGRRTFRDLIKLMPKAEPPGGNAAAREGRNLA